MTKPRFYIPGIFLLLGLAYAINMDWLQAPQARAPTPLEKAGNDCAGIADNAVAHMQAVVAFQVLEKEGRKINVMRRCMADHGYMANPKWLAYGAPMAKEQALKNGISEAEAIESLRRLNMMVFTAKDQQPIYWVAKP
ncbi:MAG: hypothetical protein LAC66_05190 [Methylotenera sp.]|nr:hypothetical protein [Methylotenera sp.]